MSARIATFLLVLSGLVFLANADLVAAGPTQNGTCVFPNVDCKNQSYSLANGYFSYNSQYDGTKNTCEARNGIYNESSSVLAVAACTIGCCCGTTNTSIFAGTACAAGNTYKPLLPGDDLSCKLTCEQTNPPPKPQCGEGTLTNADINACLCGTNTPVANKYCCWNGDIRNNAIECAVKPQTACTTNQAISGSCLCGAETKTNGFCCASNTWATTADECPAPRPVAPACGNLRLDVGEACDAQYVYDFANPQGWTNTSGYGCTLPGSSQLNRSQYCSTTCECVQTVLPGSCNNNNICEQPAESTATCANDCPAVTCTNVNAPSNVVATFLNTIGGVNITWEVPVGCSPTEYRIYRSLKDSASTLKNPDAFSPALQNTANYYTDTPIPRTSSVAYYTLVTAFAGGRTVNVTTQVTIPNLVCPTASASYCQNGTVAVQCTDYTNTTIQCNPNSPTNPTVCGIRVTDKIADCLPAVKSCATCNGIFASFPNDLERVNEGANRIMCSQALTCYKDLGNTSIELYKSCANTNSCASYRTENACELNECGKPGNCEWRPLTDAPWTGACIAQDNSFQKCSDCTIANGCTKQICEQSSACYFFEETTDQIINTDITATGCYDKKEIPCELYPTQLACEGNSKYELNVTYVNGVRTGGDHAIESRSNDQLQHGKCVWYPTDEDEGVCKRDADYNNEPDMNQIFVPNNANILPYLLDFTNPFSAVLAVPNQVYPARFSVPIANDSPVRAWITKNPAQCYPLNDSIVSGQTVEWLFRPGADDGDWTLCYYGEDRSKNIEQVQKFKFRIDPTPPVIQANHTATLIPFSSGGYRTAVIAEFNTSEASTCKATLEFASGGIVSQQHGGIDGTFVAYGTRFSVSYPQLIDETYALRIECTDAGRNTATLVHNFAADTDGTISDAKPKDTNRPFNVSNIVISVRTDENANCRYGIRGMTYNEMLPYTTTGERIHNATINRLTGDYQLQTACNFDGSVVYGGASDDTYFSVDTQAPQTVLCDGHTTDGSATNCVTTPFVNTGAEEFKVTLRCIDSPQSSLSFGCSKDMIRYCKAALNMECTPTTDPYGNPTILFSGTQPEKLRYQSIDRGGNLQPVQELIINLTDKTPPTITFTID